VTFKKDRLTLVQSKMVIDVVYKLTTHGGPYEDDYDPCGRGDCGGRVIHLIQPERCTRKWAAYHEATLRQRRGGAKAGVAPNQCPDNYYISAFQAIKDNPNQRAINVWCKPLPKVSAMPSDPSEKAHNAKEAPSSGGGPKVECEDGYYTSAFALRVDAPGGLTGQRSVDFWCKPFPKVSTMPGNLGETGPANTGYDPAGNGDSKVVHSADGYFISAIQIIQAPNPQALPAREANVWFRPVQQN
jgi:hypothetical protein